MTNFGNVGMMAWRVLTNGAISYVQGRMADGSLFKPTPKPLGETAIPLGDESAGGCPICGVHRQVAEGWALLRGLAETYEAEGRIPQGIGGTIPLARRNFEDAQVGLTRIAAADANLRLQAVTAQGHLTNLITGLYGNVAPDALPSLAGQAEQAWRETYRLADLAFRHDTPPADLPLARDPLYLWLQRARSERWDAERAMAELQTVIDSPPAGEEE